MSGRGKYRKIKHITFNLIDLFCLAFSFFLAYFIKFKSLNIFIKVEWLTLLVVMCAINVFCTIIQRTYIGILKRRYYQQFQKELFLFITQVAILCGLLFAFKIGESFSRQMVFTTYISYFMLSQVMKYIRKKFITGEFSSKKKEAKTVFEENTDEMEFKCVDNRSEVQKLATEFIKRSFDIVAGIIGCIILIPLSLFVFVINKLSKDDDGPLFYVHERIGKNGAKFKMIKFRSMVIDADEKLERFLEENEDVRKEFLMYRKIKNDPRVTKVGGFLRKTSLDEMPQFINVLIGDMSVVGPRAVVEDELEKFGIYKHYVFSVKPGITGNWAANGRSNTSYEERVMLECQYVNNYSIKNDIKIIFKTIISVLKKEGAV